MPKNLGIIGAVLATIAVLGLLKAIGVDLTGWLDTFIGWAAEGWTWLGRLALRILDAVGEG